MRLQRHASALCLQQSSKETSMRKSPFLKDPRDETAKHVAAAVVSPVEAVIAAHIDLAEHFAAIARVNRLPPKGS